MITPKTTTPTSPLDLNIVDGHTQGSVDQAAGNTENEFYARHGGFAQRAFYRLVSALS